MDREKLELIKEYLRFIIDKKEVTGKGYKNRKACDFYRVLKQDAELYKVSFLDVLYQRAEYVMNGKYISLR